MAGVISVDLDRIYEYVEAQAMRGVASATEYAVGRIKKHAPVRSIFRGTTFRTGKAGFREPITRRVSYRGEQRIGHANSSLPLFRTVHKTGSVFITGDFRRVDPSVLSRRRPGKLLRGVQGKLATIGTGAREGTIGEGGVDAFGLRKATQYSVGGSEKAGELSGFVVTKGGRVSKIDPSQLKSHTRSGETVQTSGGRALTTRGKYEVRMGRANFRSPDDGITRVGGRLKGEIHMEGPIIEDGIIWGYVVSATKDPETGTLYPWYQEFGSAHNRPHPFMRPGLHESRGRLRRDVKGAVRRGPQ